MNANDTAPGRSWSAADLGMRTKTVVGCDLMREALERVELMRERGLTQARLVVVERGGKASARVTLRSRAPGFTW